MGQSLIAVLLSFLMGVILTNIGGSLAEVSNTSGTFLGFTFRATGAIGGFFLVLFAFVRVYDHFSKAPTPFDVSLKVRAADQQFKIQDSYVAHCTVNDKELKVEPQWEDPNYLAIDLNEVLPDDKIAVVIKNRDDDDRQWKVTRFLVKNPPLDARFIGPRADAGPRVQGRRDAEVGQGPTGSPSIQVEQKQPSAHSAPQRTTGGRGSGVGPLGRDAAGMSKT